MGDLQVELKRIGARLSHCGQALENKHSRITPGWWTVVLVRASDDEARPQILSGRAAPTLELALAKAIQAWNNWTPPDYGASINDRAVKRLSGDDLLKELGL